MIKEKDFDVFLDGISTIMIVLISPLFIIALRYIWIFLIKISPRNIYKYSHVIISIVLFLLGIKVRFSGKFCPEAKLMIFNHTSPLDYLLIPLSLPMKPYNIVAGENLILSKVGPKNNNPTIEDKVVSWFIGDIIKEFLIPLDRKNDLSKIRAYRKMLKEIRNGKIVALSPESGRISKSEIDKGMLLKEEFSDSAFRAAFDNNHIMQIAVFDWPVIWRGKDDDRFGIHPTTIKISYIAVNPSDFASAEHMKRYCYEKMEMNLASSKNVRRFLKSNAKVRH